MTRRALMTAVWAMMSMNRAAAVVKPLSSKIRLLTIGLGTEKCERISWDKLVASGSSTDFTCSRWSSSSHNASSNEHKDCIRADLSHQPPESRAQIQEVNAEDLQRRWDNYRELCWALDRPAESLTDEANEVLLVCFFDRLQDCSRELIARHQHESCDEDEPSDQDEGLWIQLGFHVRYIISDFGSQINTWFDSFYGFSLPVRGCKGEYFQTVLKQWSPRAEGKGYRIRDLGHWERAGEYDFEQGCYDH